MINTIWDLISCLEGFLFGVPIVLYFTTYNFKHIQNVIALFVTIISGEFIKFNIIGDASPRPALASNCNMLCNNGAQGGKPGMPSTHMAIVTAFCTLYFPSGTINESIKNPIVYGFAILIIAMGAARYYKNCHTLEQIVVGTLFGFVCGYLAKVLIHM